MAKVGPLITGDRGKDFPTVWPERTCEKEQLTSYIDLKTQRTSPWTKTNQMLTFCCGYSKVDAMDMCVVYMKGCPIVDQSLINPN